MAKYPLFVVFAVVVIASFVLASFLSKYIPAFGSTMSEIMGTFGYTEPTKCTLDSDNGNPFAAGTCSPWTGAVGDSGIAGGSGTAGQSPSATDTCLGGYLYLVEYYCNTTGNSCARYDYNCYELCKSFDYPQGWCVRGRCGCSEAAENQIETEMAIGYTGASFYGKLARKDNKTGVDGKYIILKIKVSFVYCGDPEKPCYLNDIRTLQMLEFVQTHSGSWSFAFSPSLLPTYALAECDKNVLGYSNRLGAANCHNCYDISSGRGYYSPCRIDLGLKISAEVTFLGDDDYLPSAAYYNTPAYNYSELPTFYVNRTETTSTTSTIEPQEEAFSASNLSCSPALEGWNCKVNVLNYLNEETFVIFLFTNSTNYLVGASASIVPTGGYIVATNYTCQTAGTNFVSWKAYRSSDTDLLEPVTWSPPAERKSITC